MGAFHFFKIVTKSRKISHIIGVFKKETNTPQNLRISFKRAPIS